ncbi:MAG: universal stress protein [Paracoccaceae bacterium]
MKRILHATDFSERSDRALRRAVLLARETGAHLDLVHVVDDDRPRRIVDHETADAHLLLHDLARTLERDDGVSCAVQVLLEDPFAGIVKAVQDTTPDLLVIGPHRRQILRDAFVGTTAERTIRAVSCPVLMVNGPPFAPYRHVLLTTDLSDAARAAIRRFDGLAIGKTAERSVLSVFEAPALRLTLSGTMAEEDQADYLADQRVEARSALSQFMADLGPGQATQIVRHEKSNVATEILLEAADLKSDLIVISTQGKGAMARMLLGSVTEQVLRVASVDVLAVPPEPEAPAAI